MIPKWRNVLRNWCILIILKWLYNLPPSASRAPGACIRRPGFALIRVSCRCVINVMLLVNVCCTRLIRTRIIVCSASFHPVLREFDTLEQPVLHMSSTSIAVGSIKVWNFPICMVFQQAQVRLWNYLPYSVLHRDAGLI